MMIVFLHYECSTERLWRFSPDLEGGLPSISFLNATPRPAPARLLRSHPPPLETPSVIRSRPLDLRDRGRFQLTFGRLRGSPFSWQYPMAMLPPASAVFHAPCPPTCTRFAMFRSGVASCDVLPHGIHLRRPQAFLHLPSSQQLRGLAVAGMISVFLLPTAHLSYGEELLPGRDWSKICYRYSEQEG